MTNEFEVFDPDKEFEDLTFDYLMSGLVPLSGWATGDLVTLHHLIDAELQSRADEGDEVGEHVTI